MTYVQTMLTLRQALFELDLTQELIDIGRVVNRTRRMQLAMDRKQVEVDHKRAQIQLTILGIATLN
jgi:hypothetical protein